MPFAYASAKTESVWYAWVFMNVNYMCECESECECVTASVSVCKFITNHRMNTQ
jgi:hypothetical protein